MKNPSTGNTDLSTASFFDNEFCDAILFCLQVCLQADSSFLVNSVEKQNSVIATNR